MEHFAVVRPDIASRRSRRIPRLSSQEHIGRSCVREVSFLLSRVPHMARGAERLSFETCSYAEQKEHVNLLSVRRGTMT